MGHPDTKPPTPPPDTELGDLLPDLAARGVTIDVTPAVPWLDPCSGCAEDRAFAPYDAVAVIVYTVTNRPDAYRYRSPSCPVCLWAEVGYQLRRGANVTVEVPASIGAAA